MSEEKEIGLVFEDWVFGEECCPELAVGDSRRGENGQEERSKSSKGTHSTYSKKKLPVTNRLTLPYSLPQLWGAMVCR